MIVPLIQTALILAFRFLSATDFDVA